MTEYSIPNINPSDTNLIQITELKDSFDDSFINSATVQIDSIKNLDDVEVTGLTFPITMNYVAASNGNYKADIPNTSNMVYGKYYKIYITATISGKTKNFIKSIKAKLSES